MYNRTLLVGSNEIPLSSITNQEEYDLDLEINNENDNEPILSIKTKLTFIWSQLQKYTEEFELNKKKIDKFNSILTKSKNIRDNLDKPFNILSEVKIKESGGKKAKTSQQEYELADRIESQIKASLNMNVIRWGFFTKLLLFALLGLSFLNLFTRADFINVLLPVFMLGMLSSSLQSKLIENLTLFFIASTLTLGTDFLWLFFRASVSKLFANIL